MEYPNLWRSSKEAWRLCLISLLANGLLAWWTSQWINQLSFSWSSAAAAGKQRIWFCFVSWLTDQCILEFSQHRLWGAKQWALYRRAARGLFHISLRCFLASLFTRKPKLKVRLTKKSKKPKPIFSCEYAAWLSKKEGWGCFVLSLFRFLRKPTITTPRLLLTWSI